MVSTAWMMTMLCEMCIQDRQNFWLPCVEAGCIAETGGGSLGDDASFLACGLC